MIPFKKVILLFKIAPGTKHGCYWVRIKDLNGRVYRDTHHQYSYWRAYKSGWRSWKTYTAFALRVWITGKNKNGVKCKL